MSVPVHVIRNPFAGTRPTAPADLQQRLADLLQAEGISFSDLHFRQRY
jgi:hypothetical protein